MASLNILVIDGYRRDGRESLAAGQQFPLAGG